MNSAKRVASSLFEAGVGGKALGEEGESEGSVPECLTRFRGGGASFAYESVYQVSVITSCINRTLLLRQKKVTKSRKEKKDAPPSPNPL